MRIFISYAHEDKTIADRLYESLVSIPGVLPWLDLRQLVPGQDWEREIRQAMQESELVILLLSNNSVNKAGYIQKEVRRALDLLERRPPDEIFLLPARIEACEPRFDELQKIHRVDLFDDWDKGVLMIRKAVENRQAHMRAIKKKADEAQREKNRADAANLKIRLSHDLLENLSNYSVWINRHEWIQGSYADDRERIPNWTKQAKPEWVELLQQIGVLESGDGSEARFTDVGLELLEIL